MKKLILTAITAALLVLAGCGAVGNAMQGNPGGGGTAAGTSIVNMSAINFVSPALIGRPVDVLSTAGAPFSGVSVPLVPVTR